MSSERHSVSPELTFLRRATEAVELLSHVREHNVMFVHVIYFNVTFLHCPLRKSVKAQRIRPEISSGLLSVTGPKKLEEEKDFLTSLILCSPLCSSVSQDHAV